MGNGRKISPQSPLALRRVVSAGLMTRSLGPLDGIGGLARSNSYSAGTCDSRTPVTVQRSGSVRRKILPAFEPLSESTESESDEEKKRAGQGMRKSEHPEKEGQVKSAPTSAKQEEQEERREELRTPGPVDIVGAGEEFEEGEISSSSEIEVGESSRSSEVEAFLERCGEEAFAPNLHRECRSPVSPISSPDAEPELTLRADGALVVGPNKQMNSSLPSYDLQRLFHNIHTTPTTKESGGESMITDEAVFSDASTGSGKTNSNNSSSIMTDSLHAVVWEEEEEQ